MPLYGAFDLHAKTNHLGIIDGSGKRVLMKKLPNEASAILETLKSMKRRIVGLVVESTYNWYWLVDLLMKEGYKVHLANTSAIQKYSGMKHADDQDDAFWLCDMLRLNILPEGYIYPGEDRPIRDLLRKRMHLVKVRTSLIVSLQNIICRNNGFRLKTSDVKALREDRIAQYLGENEDLALAGAVLLWSHGIRDAGSGWRRLVFLAAFAGSAAAVSTFGPKQYTRASGPPQTITDIFPRCAGGACRRRVERAPGSRRFRCW